MDYIIIGVLGIIIILLMIVLLKKNKTDDMIERLGRLETNMVKEIGDFKYDFSKSMLEDFEKLNKTIEERLMLINEKVNSRLDENFDKTNKTFTSVLERLTKIDEAQKKIEDLSTDIVSLQSVLTDKKSRGTFGETNLYYILSNVFGEKNNRIYQTQYTLNNGFIADAILFAPEPLGTICIDSKFPLENYKRMIDVELSKSEREGASKLFKTNVKKHIDDISNKYIIPGTTASEAIMFLPAEAIFAELNAYHEDIVRYAYSKKVWIASPTTLMSTLTVIEMILKNIERDKYAKIIHDELNKLSKDFGLYKERWDKLSRSIETVNKDVKDINVTTDKITKRFESINKVDIKELLIEEKKEDE